MPNYVQDFDMIRQKTIDNNDFIQCPQCKSIYMENIEVIKVLQTNTYTLGQPAMNFSRLPFYVLRCVKCNTIVEMPISPDATFQEMKEYENLIKLLNTK